MERWNGEYDQTQLDAAIAELGIRRPVTFTPQKEAVPRGDHRVKRGKHLIRATSRCVGCRCGADHDNTAKDVNYTILHELAHAMQAERDGIDELLVRYERYSALVGYDNNPYEVEANILAGRLSKRFTIAR